VGRAYGRRPLGFAPDPTPPLAPQAA
jgi:hypothetical protein